MVKMIEKTMFKRQQYFSYLHTHPIVACTHGLSSALEWLSTGQAAHLESCRVETQISRLQETARKLHVIQPDMLVRAPPCSIFAAVFTVS